MSVPVSKDQRLKKAKNVAAFKGGECLSTEYTNSASNMQWRCANGHTFEATYNNVVNNHTWCRKCAAAIRGENRTRYCKQKAMEKQMLDTRSVYIPSSLNRTPEDTSDIFGINDEEQHELEKDENWYLRAYMPTRWRCPKGHEWDATYDSVFRHGFGCKACRTPARNTNKKQNTGDEE